jgi:hypothetical protein
MMALGETCSVAPKTSYSSRNTALECLYDRQAKMTPKENSHIEVRFSEALISRDRARRLFRTLALSPSQRLSLLNDWLNKGQLTLSTDDNAKNFAEESGGEVELASARELLQTYLRLESLRRALGWTGRDFLDWFVKESSEEEAIEQAKAEAVIRLFTPSPEVDLLYKARRIYEGAVPSFVQASTTVDYRPVYSENLAIEHGLITCVLELLVRKPEETTETQRISIQVDLEDIGELKSVLDRAIEKIRRLKEWLATSGKVRLFNPTATLTEEEE